jgi:hypothetical protein
MAERLALFGLIAFYGASGRRLALTNDAAHEFVMAIAPGSVTPSLRSPSYSAELSKT